MATEINSTEVSVMSREMDRQLAEKLNEEMRLTVLPVTIFVGFEAVFGFFGNLLILYVFLLYYHKCNYKYFVLCLSFIDTTSTLTTIPGEIVTQTFWYVYPVTLVCKIKSFFNVFTVCGCAFALLIIAIDRYRKVCRPVAWQIKPRQAIILILVQLIISFFIALPVSFLWGTHSFIKEYDGRNITVTVCEIDAKFLNTDYPLKYTIVTETIVSITMFILLILYIFVVRQLLKMKPGDRKKPVTAENSYNQQNSDVTLSGRTVSDDDTSGQCQDIDLSDTADSTTSLGADDVSMDTNPRELTADKGATTMVPALNMVTSAMAASKLVSPLSTKINILAVPTKTLTMSARREASRKSSKIAKIRRKTLIMFILTVLFICTTVLYFTLLSFIAKGVLESLTSAGKTAYFFFFRLHFINHAINPILYGILDPKFRRVLKQNFLSCKNRCFSRKSCKVTE